MRFGFDIGFPVSAAPCAMVHSPNHPSAFKNSAFISEYLTSKYAAGETAGPFSSPPFCVMHISGLGVAPKHNGKLRLIHGLSSPTGVSVNDGISRDQFSHVTIDMAILAIMRTGPGSFLTKVDIRDAFRLCPVRPSDWPCLGIEWQGMFYYDCVLPFDLCSAPFIFNSFADSIEWILKYTCHLDAVMHYLDDFLEVTGPSLALVTAHRDLILKLLAYLSVPVDHEKVEDPSTKLVFLGIELATVTLSSHLPDDKVKDIRSSLRGILAHCSVSHRELASVVGRLSFASRAIIAGRTFLRRMYDPMRATEAHKPVMLHLPDPVLQDFA